MTTATYIQGAPIRVRAPRSAHQRRARLTRRGRSVVVLGFLLLLVVGGFLLGQVSSQAASSDRVLGPRTVTVQPGETLWTLSTRIAPHVDPRLVVTQIEQLNHLSGAQLIAGQQLLVPRSR